MKTAIAKYLLSRQPAAVVNRLQRAKLEKLGLIGDPSIKIEDAVTVPQSILIEAAKTCLSSGEDEQLELGDSRLVVTQAESAIEVSVSKNEEVVAKTRIPFLLLMAPQSSIRLRVLRTLQDEFGPTAGDLLSLEKVAATRALQGKEIAELWQQLDKSVLMVQGRIRQKIKSGELGLADLLVDSLHYYERFCGPDPDDASASLYISSSLAEYRQKILNSDLAKGLEISLMGCLHDDLCPGSWLQSVSNDHLWEALKAFDAESDPFSLLGGLDIAFYRLEDDRFSSFATDGISTLLDRFVLNAEENPARAKNYAKLLAALVHWLQCEINLLEGAMARPPFWRRLCAWMQAISCSRQLALYGVDVDELMEVIESQMSVSGRYALFLDLRQEPRVAAYSFSAQRLRGEILGRLFVLLRRHEREGRSVDWGAGKPEDEIMRIAQSEDLHIFMPGPLEGHSEPALHGSGKLPYVADEVADNIEGWLTVMGSLSLTVRLEEALWSKVKAGLEKELSKFGMISEEAARTLNVCANLVISQNDSDFAEVVAAKTIDLAKYLGPEYVRFSIRVLLFCGSVFQDDREWVRWIGEKLSGLASSVPEGEACEELWLNLRKVEEVLAGEHSFLSLPSSTAAAGW